MIQKRLKSGWRKLETGVRIYNKFRIPNGFRVDVWTSLPTNILYIIYIQAIIHSSGVGTLYRRKVSLREFRVIRRRWFLIKQSSFDRWRRRWRALVQLNANVDDIRPKIGFRVTKILNSWDLSSSRPRTRIIK